MRRFISCDWGSSSFRLRLVGEVAPYPEIKSDVGASVLSRELTDGAGTQKRAWLFGDYLRGQIEDLEGVVEIDIEGLPVVISGMATSAHGWKELPYARAPLAVDGSDLRFGEETLDGGGGASRRVYFISGVRTETDVMRGEECEIVGLTQTTTWDDVGSEARLVMPGTHSKHIVVRDGVLEGFRTYMTGEMFSVLAEHSVLSRTIASPDEEVTDGVAFREGVRTAHDRGLPAGLFEVRTNGLFDRYDAADNTAFLSGLLIGAELGGMGESGRNATVVLCAGTRMAGLYAAALEATGREKYRTVPAETVDVLSALGHRAFLKSHGVLD